MSKDKAIESPYIPPEKSVREITALSLVLGAILSIVMGAANTYLGLYAGMTVSASIPAAVISMAILRGVFRRGTILENNIVQTMASTGESLAAGVIFTVPALVMVGAWQDFKLWPTTLIVGLGGILGIVFMVPMRRALIVDRKDLIYPEGVACAEVLKTGDKGGGGIWSIVIGVAVGGLFKALVSGVSFIHGTVETAIAKGRSVIYFGSDMSVALMAVGYIVNLNIAVLITIGGFIGWFIAIPLLGGYDPGHSPIEWANTLWSTQVRYLGVGAMLIGGIYSIWSVRGGIAAGLTGLKGVSKGAVEDAATGKVTETPRTQRDMSLKALMPIFLIATLATFFFYDYLIGSMAISLVTTVLMVVTAFLFVAVATYIAGLVGSSNSPVSGMTICALLISAGVLLALGIKGESAILATLGVAGVVCCATCTSGDVAQDLKTGHLVGATPAKLQMTELIAAVIPAFFFAPILTLLHNAYGIGTGEPGALRAPQAALFASLAEGFFGDGDLPWNLVIIGMGIGAALIFGDSLLKRANSSFRLHVMPVAVGIYLPVALDVPILIGGLIRFILERRRSAADKAAGETGSGVLFGSGLIAGEALMGIGIAIYLAAGMKFDWLKPLPDFSNASEGFYSLGLFALVIIGYVMMARKRS
jgi:putative OPT family oligopeptide transporter